jgi:hypothetical protein
MVDQPAVAQMSRARQRDRDPEPNCRLQPRMNHTLKRWCRRTVSNASPSDPCSPFHDKSVINPRSIGWHSHSVSPASSRSMTM